MSEPQPDAQTVIDALRLAREASDDSAYIRIADSLLDKAPATDPNATLPVQLLLEAIEDSGCQLGVIRA